MTTALVFKMHGFYAFCIISICFSIPHFAIAIVGITSIYGVASGIASIILSLIGFSLSVALTVILSQYLYCGQTVSITYPLMHYCYA